MHAPQMNEATKLVTHITSIVVVDEESNASNMVNDDWVLSLSVSGKQAVGEIDTGRMTNTPTCMFQLTRITKISP